MPNRLGRAGSAPKGILRVALAVAVVAFGLHAAPPASARPEVRTRVIVGVAAPFRAEPGMASSEAAQQRRLGRAAQQQVLDALDGTEHRVVRRYASVPFLALDVDAAAYERLAASPSVTSLSIDRPLTPYLQDSIPLVGADQAWVAGATGSGGSIAVLDTGVDSSHPFLAGKVIHQACFLAGGGCPNGSTSQIGAGAAAPCAETNCWHGTHVAGIAGGLGTSGSTPPGGVAKGASIVAVRVFNSGGDQGIQATTADLIAGLEHVYENRATLGVAAVNISLGRDLYTSSCAGTEPAVEAVVANLRADGIATVAAAGNSSSMTGIGFPACLPDVVSVGMTTKTDTVPTTANTAPFLTLAAPGATIRSSIPGTGYAERSGSSMASPHVAGAIAALHRAVPTASVSEIVSALRSTGQPVSRGADTFPRLRVDAALDALDPPAAGIALRGGPVTSGSGTSSLSVALPSGVVAGDVVLASVSVDNGTGLTTPAGWSLVPGWPVASGTQAYRVSQYLFYRVATGSDPSSVTVVKSRAKPASAVAVALSGVDAAAPFDVSAVRVGAWTSVPSPVVTTTVDGAFLLGLVSVRNGSGDTSVAVTPPAWLTEQAELGVASITGELATASQTAAGSIGSGSFGLSPKGHVVAAVLALRPDS